MPHQSNEYVTFDDILKVLYTAMIPVEKRQAEDVCNLLEYLIQRNKRDDQLLQAIYKTGYHGQYILQECTEMPASLYAVVRYLEKFAPAPVAKSAQIKLNSFMPHDLTTEPATIGSDAFLKPTSMTPGSTSYYLELMQIVEDKHTALCNFMYSLCQTSPLSHTKLLSRLHSSSCALSVKIQLLSGVNACDPDIESIYDIISTIQSTMTECMVGDDSQSPVLHLQYIQDLHREALVAHDEMRGVWVSFLDSCTREGRDLDREDNVSHHHSFRKFCDKFQELTEHLGSALDTEPENVEVSSTIDKLRTEELTLQSLAISKHSIDGLNLLDLMVLTGNDKALKFMLSEWYNKSRIDLSAIRLNRKSGYSVNNLVDAGYFLAELRRAGYSAMDIRPLCSISELRRLGFSASDLRRIGCTAISLADAGYSTKDIRCAGCGVVELLSDTMWHLRSESRCHRWTFRKLRDAGYTEQELNDAGCFDLVLPVGSLPEEASSFVDEDDVLRTVLVMKSEGFTAREVVRRMQGKWGRSTALFELKAAGYSAASLLEAGFGLHDLAVVECPAEELLEMGCFTVSQLRSAGYGAAALMTARCSYKTMFEGGFTYADICSANSFIEKYSSPIKTGPQRLMLDAARVHSFSNLDTDFTKPWDAVTRVTSDEDTVANLSIRKYKDAKKRSLCEMREAGLSAREVVDILRQFWGRSVTLFELRDAGYTSADLVKSGCTASDLLSAGFLCCEMHQACVKAEALREAGCSPRTLLEGGYTLRDLLLGGFSPMDLNNSGFGANVLQDMHCDRRKIARCEFSVG